VKRDEGFPVKTLAIVTGGGTGIGRACAEKLAQNHRVICCGLDRDQDFPASLEFVKLDVTDANAIAKLAASVAEATVLVNCAGIILHEGREFQADGFRKVMDVNVTSAMLVTTAFRDALARSGGSVVNIASMWSFFGSGRNPAYAASKGAIVQLTRSLAVAFADQGIRVNAVAPGWIRTRLSAGALENPERSEAIMARLPMKRWGEPSDVADVVAFLTSHAARYVTGVILPVDGGYGIA
jgi:NAD(P)-dependent dehydrogenase (short-subunit alcohol dehydrogenase family)